MYRPSLYNKSDESLKKFAELFNENKDYPNLKFIPNKIETYDNDGIITDSNTGKSIGFDWEYRERYFENCKFDFDSLGQYERKIIKPSIQLAIQCDSTETGIAIGCHEDWIKENKIQLNLATDGKNNLEQSDIQKILKYIAIKVFLNLKLCLIKLLKNHNLIMKLFKIEKSGF